MYNLSRYSFQTQQSIFCIFASFFTFYQFFCLYLYKDSERKTTSGLYTQWKGRFQIFNLFPWPSNLGQDLNSRRLAFCNFPPYTWVHPLYKLTKRNFLHTCMMTYHTNPPHLVQGIRAWHSCLRPWATCHKCFTIKSKA